MTKIAESMRILLLALLLSIPLMTGHVSGIVVNANILYYEIYKVEIIVKLPLCGFI